MQRWLFSDVFDNQVGYLARIQVIVFSAYRRRHAKKIGGHGAGQAVLFADKQERRFYAPDNGLKLRLQRVKTRLSVRLWLSEGSGFDRVRRAKPYFLRGAGIARHRAGFFGIHGIPGFEDGST